MKKYISLMLSITVVFFLMTAYVYSDQDIELNGETAVLIDGTTGEVLYEKDMHQEMYPASTTKIMTAILTLENCDLNETVVIDSETPFTEGSRIYLLEDEKVTVEQLLHALLIESANDSAVALAKHISGSVEDFAELMNERSRELGALNTHFKNPNGLPDEDHYTSAYDLAMIAKYAMKNEKFREIIKTVNYHLPATNKQEDRYFKITNRLLWDEKTNFVYNGEYVPLKYEYATGVKTGYTIAAGSCLVGSAKKDGREVISVVLKSDPNFVYLDSRVLLDYGLNNFKNIVLEKQGNIVGNISVQGGKEKYVDAVVAQDIIRTVAVDFDESIIEKEINLPDKLVAPIEKNDRIGSLSINYNGEVLEKAEVIATSNIEKSITATAVVTVSDYFKSLRAVFLIIIVLLVGYMGLIIMTNRQRMKRRKIRRDKYGIDRNYFNRNLLK